MVRLGALLTATEARLVADGLAHGDSMTAAFSVVDSHRRNEVHALVEASGVSENRDALILALRAIEGARSQTQRVETLWTMPGHTARGGGLTSSLTSLVAGARESVVCSTYNFQQSSGMWRGLRYAAERPGILVRVYVDQGATEDPSGPSASDIAQQIAPGWLFRTRLYDGRPVRNHAKFLSIDHRFVVVTSANFSWSAEYNNIELGLRFDDRNLAERIEREMRDAEHELYERVVG